MFLAKVRSYLPFTLIAIFCCLLLASCREAPAQTAVLETATPTAETTEPATPETAVSTTAVPTNEPEPTETTTGLTSVEPTEAATEPHPTLAPTTIPTATPLPTLALNLPPYTPMPESEWATLDIESLHEQVFAALLARAPEEATQLGLAKHYGIPIDQLNDISDDYRQETFNLLARYLGHLQAIDMSQLTAEQQLSNRIFIWDLELRLQEEPFFYHNYPVRQLFSVHDQLPSLLAIDHPLASRADAEAFIARLQQVPHKFAQAETAVSLRAERNLLPPRFVFDRVSSQLSLFVATPAAENGIYLGFAARIEEAEGLSEEEKEELKTAVLHEIENSVYPAYRQLANFVSNSREQAGNEDGVWRLENGREFYAYTLRHHTTTNLTAAEIHELGLQEIERIQAQIEPLLIELGYSGNLPRDVGRFYRDGNNIRITDDASRAQVLDAYREAVATAETALAPLFNLTPRSPLLIQRVPPFQEAGSPAFYSPPPLDGSRPGIFFAPLGDGTNVSVDGMMTLAIHEAIPGHHFQLAIQTELDTLPTFRRVLSYTGYAEGWALYTEQLASEQGLYDDNPRGELARLIESDLFRAARLVVDTGIHDLGWSREEALTFMNDLFGFQWTSEIERYIAWPGQATGYKIGELTMRRLRTKAETALGDRFDLAEFHTVILENGAVPLFLLEELVDDYIAEQN
ncbi:MAG: DUF885 domain-containing protein [Chloroflexota bacterium]